MSEARRPDDPIAPPPGRARPRPRGLQHSLKRRVRNLAHGVEARADQRGRPLLPLRMVRVAVHVFRQYLRDRCPQQASSLSFQTVLSVVPLMAVALAVLRATKAIGAESVLVDFIADKLVPISKNEISQRLQTLSENVTFASLGLVGLIFAVLLAFTMINSLEGVINRIWRSERRRPLTQKFVVFYATATLGPFILGASLYQAVQFGLTSGWTGLAFSFLSTMAGFFLLNVFLPVVKVRVRAAFVGAASATLLFELAKHGFGIYVAQFAFERYSGIYGALAVLPLWLVWIYYSWLVVLFGVETTHAVHNAHLIQRLDRRGSSELENELLQRVNGVVATRIMVAVSRAYVQGERVLPRERLADRFDLSAEAIDRLVLRLKDNGLLLEVEGDDIGLIPARPPNELSVADVLEVFRDTDVRELQDAEADSPLDRLLAEIEADETRRTHDVTLAELV